jgi:hypothetical protein
MNCEYPLPEFLTWSGKNKVKHLIGHRIKNMFRYSSGTRENILRYYREYNINIEENQMFSLVEGSLRICLDTSAEFSFFKEESWLSLAFNMIRNEYGKKLIDTNIEKLIFPDDSFCINVTDSVYSNGNMASYINKTITNIKIFKNKTDIKKVPITDNYHGDRAIAFVFEDMSELVLGYNLISVIPTMSVTLWNSLDRKIIDGRSL